MSKKLSALVLRGGGMSREDLLADHLETDWSLNFAQVNEERELARELAAQVDVIVGGPIRGGIPEAARLQLYHAPFTGYDWITPEDLPRSAVFCNTYEHETTIAEHILAGMLEWRVGLSRQTAPMMQAKSWNGRHLSYGPPHRELRGSVVGIIGYGHIGREVARRAKAFGMEVMALSRTPRTEPELVDWYGTPDQMDVLLTRSDFVIVTAPGGPETRGMIAGPQFARMKPDAVIANVGRGEVIDEAALYQALVSKQIEGAIIDVWYVYPSADNPNPWPSRFPFHKLNNIIMSPHNSAWTREMSERRWAFVGANLDRLARGEPLHNVCFEGKRSG